MRLSTKAFEAFILKNKPPSRIILTKEEQLEKQRCEESFYEFCKSSWHTIHPNIKYVDGWHIRASCDHYQAYLKGRPGVKVHNLPPRHMKSTIKVMFGAWVWIERPWFQVMHISADSDLVIRDNMQIKDIIKSKWYQKYWGDRFKIRKDLDGKELFGNDKGGISLTKTILSSITGHNADAILLDDCNTQNDIYHLSSRNQTNDTFDNAISTRLNDPNTGFIVNNQQRLCDGDLTDHILRTRRNVTHLCLPLEKEAETCSTIVFPGTQELWKDPRKKGELLWPERFNRDYVDNVLKVALRTPQNIAAQLQQKPSPDEGLIFLKEWIKRIPKEQLPASYEYVIQSVDPALTNNAESCYAAITTWGVYKKDYKPYVMLLHCERKKLQYPDLKPWVKKWRDRFYNLPSKDYFLVIENGGGGIPLRQELISLYNIECVEFNPQKYGLKKSRLRKNEDDYEPKVHRAKLASPYFKEGIVSIPIMNPATGISYPSFEEFFDLLCKFPANRDGMDYIDSMSQAFLWMSDPSRSIIEPIDLAPMLPKYDWKYEHEIMQAEQEQGYVDTDRFTVRDNRSKSWMINTLTGGGVISSDIFEKE